jgi:capsular exopolysaccharide synthesis family protein
VSKYRGLIYVTPSLKETSILEVTARDNNIFRAIDFLDKVAEEYQQDNLDRKNKNAQRTMDFISSQLQNISDSLWISENELQQFQTKTNVMNISFQSQQVLEQMNELDKEKSELENRNKYYTNLKEYINSGQNLESIIAPSAIGIADPLLNSLINDLNKLEVTKSTMTFIKDPDHPKLKAINSQIESIKNTMLENANNILAQSQIALADVNARLRRVQAQVNSLPATERNYVTIERKYKLNSETYNFLLEKFSEAQIAKASNYPDSQVIESASFSRLVSPDKRKNYSIALLLGLLLPGSIIFLKEFLSKKISSVEDIKSVSSLPILGYIFQNLKEDSSTTLLLDKPNSPAVRSKLNLITGMNAKPVIAVTSTFPQEGKSYNAINIASSFAMLNKKTVLLDLDLRNSKIRKIFQIESDEGVVNYILGKSTLTDITFNSKHQYLSIVPAGPYPSEPGEMFANDRVTKLLHELKELYDVIIIDSLPVGLFPDLFYLREEIDVTIYVVRHQYTHNEALKAALEEVTDNKMKGVNILVNYVKHGKRNFGYGYEYGHIYGYGYSYSNDGQKKGKKKKLMK